MYHMAFEDTLRNNIIICKNTIEGKLSACSALHTDHVTESLFHNNEQLMCTHNIFLNYKLKFKYMCTCYLRFSQQCFYLF